MSLLLSELAGKAGYSQVLHMHLRIACVGLVNTDVTVCACICLSVCGRVPFISDEPQSDAEVVFRSEY